MSDFVGGKKRQDFEEKQLYVGFGLVKVVAFNPSRSELNKLLGIEDKDDDKEIEYKSEYEGIDRLRCTFWLREESTNKLFTYSFNLLNKERQNKDGNKWQFSNNVCETAWSDEEEGENLKDFFTHFIDFKSKEVIGPKKYKKAIQGEEELLGFIKAWFGKLDFYDSETNVSVNLKELFAEKFKSIQNQIGNDFEDSFVALFGVRTVVPKEGEENQEIKQYQQIWKAFLPKYLMKFIRNGKFTEKSQKTFDKYVDSAEGEYGFNAFFKTTPLSLYDKSEDLASSETPIVETSDTDTGY